jgi:hypothetical protein
MNSQVEPASNLRRIHRLLEEVTLETGDVLAMMDKEGQGKVKLSLDRFVVVNPQNLLTLGCLWDLQPRSEWSSAGQKNNLLTLGVACQNSALPLVVHDLDKAGCSSSTERMAMVDQLLETLPSERIEVLTGDREFASVAFVKHLIKRKVNFALRLPKDTLITFQGNCQSASTWFYSTTCKLLKAAEVFGVTVNLAGKRLKNGDFLIVMTNLEASEGFRLYRERWRIETLFGILKSRGFNLEQSRLSCSLKLQRLVMLLGLAILWALRVGEAVVAQQPTRIMPNGFPLLSVFRRGLDALRALFIENDARFSLYLLASRYQSFVTCIGYTI